MSKLKLEVVQSGGVSSNNSLEFEGNTLDLAVSFCIALDGILKRLEKEDSKFIKRVIKEQIDGLGSLDEN